MKQILFGLFLAVSLLSFVGCGEANGTSAEERSKRCLENPLLPECQDTPTVMPGEDPMTNPSIDDDL